MHGGEDRRAEQAMSAVKAYLVTGMKEPLKAMEQEMEMRDAESGAAAGCGWGGEAAWFAARATLFAVEAARKTSDKKAANKAAKASYAAAMSKGWEHSTYEGGMVGQHVMQDGDVDHELKRLRHQITTR
jgi:hypothetical protein